MPLLASRVTQYMENKASVYEDLVRERKQCTKCMDPNNGPTLMNPSCVPDESGVPGGFDSSAIGPWTVYQGNLDARVMVVGQDWAGVNWFREHRGRDASSATNDALRRRLEQLGVHIPSPHERSQKPSTYSGVAYFTNAILCLKTGKDGDPVRAQWINNCRDYLHRQIKIVAPRAIVCMGWVASYSVTGRTESLRDLLAESREGFPVLGASDGTRAFPVYHLSPRTRSIRSEAEQEQDWAAIGRWLNGSV
jgi:uracil-DNA glycosylase family 4